MNPNISLFKPAGVVIFAGEVRFFWLPEFLFSGFLFL
jgi:hypothetical protein